MGLSANVLTCIEIRYTDFGSAAYDLGPSGQVISSWNQTDLTLGVGYKF